MRKWWRFYHVEEPLDSLPVNWDMIFLHLWTTNMVVTVLSGGSV